MYMNFDPDTFILMDWGFKKTAYDMLTRNGRPIIAAIMYIAGILGLSVETFYYISYWIGMLLLLLSIYIISNTLKQYIENENQRIFISYISVANIFIIEYFAFIEICGFMLAILLNCIAVQKFEHYFRTDNKGKNDIIISIVLITISMLTYQSIISLYIILSLPILFKYSNKIKDVIKNMIQLAIPYVTASIIYLVVSTKIINTTRSVDIEYSGLVSIFKKLILYPIETICSTNDIIPSGIFVYAIAIMIVLGYNKKNSIRYTISTIVILLISLILCGAPSLMSNSIPANVVNIQNMYTLRQFQVVSLSARVAYPLASMLGVLIVNGYINNDNKKNNYKTIMYIVIALIALQCVQFNNIYINRYKVNYADKQTAEFINQAITEYQNETNTTVTKIAVYQDSDSRYYDESLYTHNGTTRYNDLSGRDFIETAYNSYWANITCINYYLGTNYERAEQDEKYIKYFEQFDWTTLSSQQLVFDNDTLHLCVY
jgi:hypothetical protein